MSVGFNVPIAVATHIAISRMGGSGGGGSNDDFDSIGKFIVGFVGLLCFALIVVVSNDGFGTRTQTVVNAKVVQAYLGTGKSKNTLNFVLEIDNKRWMPNETSTYQRCPNVLYHVERPVYMNRFQGLFFGDHYYVTGVVTFCPN